MLVTTANINHKRVSRVGADAVFGQRRYRPQNLDRLVRDTRFSRQEIQRLYRGIKQFCPTGMVDIETFITIFRTLFPQGGKRSFPFNCLKNCFN